MVEFDRRKDGKVGRRAISRSLVALPLSHALTTMGHSMQALSSASADSSSEFGVNLVIRTRGGQSVFQIGEMIRLELWFTSTIPNKYQLTTTPYSRVPLGHNSEGIEIQPQVGWDDPLDLYFRSCDFYYEGGAVAIQSEMTTEPTVVPVELNEWVRFIEPGIYRVRVKSKRISKLDPQLGNGGVEEVTVDSNELPLTIVPTAKEWQQETLDRSLTILNGPESLAHAAVTDARREASRALRYLGTANAAQVMAQRFNDPNWHSDFILGLAGSPAREAALDEMKMLLVDPNFPVTLDFLTTMSALALARDTTENASALRIELEARFRQELKWALETKRGEARAVSTNTVLSSLR